MTLTEFLLARIAEDEAAALRGCRHNGRGVFANDNYGCLLVDPARVLAECEAKRRIVEWAQRWPMRRPSAGDGIAAEDALTRLLALPYADHPDWREEWRA